MVISIVIIIIIIITRRARAGHAEGMRPPVPSPSPRGSAATRGRAAADRDKPGNNHTYELLLLGRIMGPQNCFRQRAAQPVPVNPLPYSGMICAIAYVSAAAMIVFPLMGGDCGRGGGGGVGGRVAGGERAHG